MAVPGQLPAPLVLAVQVTGLDVLAGIPGHELIDLLELVGILVIAGGHHVPHPAFLAIAYTCASAAPSLVTIALAWAAFDPARVRKSLIFLVE
jgi:hypothetical protein